MRLLELKGVSLRFGGLTAIEDVSFAVNEKEIFAVIGPNGAGKTSLFNTITGIYRPTSGEVLFRGNCVERRFRSQTFIGFLLGPILVSMLSFFAVNIEAIWEATINANYVYQEPFPWKKAVADGIDLSRNLLAEGAWFLPILAGLLTLLATALIWKRTKKCCEIVAQAGISRTFQNIRLFRDLSVLDNVIVGMDRKFHSNPCDAVFRLPRFTRERKAADAKAQEILAFVGLAGLASSRAGNLAYGLQRRLEIARALASDPKLLLLDEPAAGMNPSEADDLMTLIREIRNKGITVLLIEHHMKVVMGISDRVAVLDYGNKIAEGTPEEISANPAVIAAYLGAPAS